MADDIIEQMRKHHDDVMRRHALAFGRRPSGEDHRAWVDHDGLEALKCGSTEWTKYLTWSGLHDLPEDEAPPSLKKLLRASNDQTFVPTIAATCVLAIGIVLGIGFSRGASFMDLVPFFIPALLFGGAMGGVALSSGLDWLWPRIFGTPVPGSPEARKRAALEALRAQPFVVLVGDRLVENVPSLSRLESWARRLTEEHSEGDRRIRALADLRERQVQIRRDLGERGPDAHIAHIDDALRRERSLLGRIASVAEDVAARHEAMRTQLDELRKRAELEHLRGQSRKLTGAASHGDGPARLAAELEVDVDDLGAEVEALQAELDQEKLRARAMSEVGGLG